MLERFAITDIQRIILVDKSEFPEAVSTFKPVLKNYELIYKFSGNMILNFNGKSYTVNEKTVYILPVGDNKNYSINWGDPGDLIAVFFKTDQEFIDKPFFKKIADGSVIDSLFKRAFATWAARGNGYYFKCVSIIFQIFYELQTDLYIPNDRLSTIKPAIDYINDHFTEKGISCTALSEMCNISYSYLRKLFKQQYKLSPSQYINKMRINYSCDLLIQNDYSVSHIAELAGFSDVFYFCRCFKKTVGITPTQYKKKYISTK